MTTIELQAIVTARIDHLKHMLVTKGAEYARRDRLSNFRRAGAMKQETPEKALIGMLAKHWVSILDMVDDLDQGTKGSPAAWNEKIGDSIAYLVLLDALVTERSRESSEARKR